MNALPRVLVIDDDFGRDWSGANRKRKGFCDRAGLLDITSDFEQDRKKVHDRMQDIVAAAVFSSGLRNVNGSAEHDLEGTLEIIRRGWSEWPRWALVFLDLKFITGKVGPDGTPEGRKNDADPKEFFGLKILERMFHDPVLKEIPVVILSGMERNRIEERFANHGALDFEPNKEELGTARLGELLDAHGLVEAEPVDVNGKRTTLTGRSVSFLKCLREARRRARRAAENDVGDNILVLGESGTGKQLIAEYLHGRAMEIKSRGGKRIGQFRTLFTQGAPETLIDDRLSGHMKGAFTGAKSDEPGEAEQGDNGTLFIDEFGCIPPILQPKFLRLLDKNTREIQRLGANSEPRKVKLQVVMATNEVAVLHGGGFRGDLLARIGIGEAIQLPPLRTRQEDILSLANLFLRKYEREFKAQKRELSQDAEQKLLDHDWPGNVRELEDAMIAAVDNWRGLKILTPNHLKLKGTVSRSSPPMARSSSEPPGSSSFSELAPSSLGDLLRLIEGFQFDPHNDDHIDGVLNRLEAAHARMLGNYLRAALMSERRKKPGKPEGELKPVPTVLRMLGDPKKKNQKYLAGRIIRRILSAIPKDEVIADPVLREMENRYPREEEKSAKENTESGTDAGSD
jgi:DNA-binding NtrC family response regulator